MLSTQELNQYEWIEFYDNRTNLKDRRTGAKVGKYLVVCCASNRWQIFQVYGGLPVAEIYIATLGDAVKIAKDIDRIYQEYLGVWEVWEDVDLLGIARLSVPDGEATYSTLIELSEMDRTVTYSDFIGLFKSKLNG